jgi:thiamine biosynthesis lipoprotein
LTSVAGNRVVDHQAGYRIGALGTHAELVVTEPAVMVAATEILHAEIERIDRVASRFRPDSEVVRLRDADGDKANVSSDLLEVLVVALRVAEATDGTVDPTVGCAMSRLGYDRDFSEVAGGVASRLPRAMPVPGWKAIEVDAANRTVRMPPGTGIDLGATAKAWAADRVAERVFGLLGCGVLVSLGGDVSVAGPPPPGGFRIGLGDVSGGMPTAGAVAIVAGGLATSGIAVRQWRLGGRSVHHILDPSTGLPAPPVWRTVSVAAASCVDANSASTAAMVKGRDALSWLASRRLPSRLVATNGIVSCIAGWPDDAVRFEVSSTR